MIRFGNSKICSAIEAALIGVGLALWLPTGLGASGPSPHPSGARIAYPVTPHVDHLDEYPGKTMNDPFHWLEDPDSPETKQWVQQENAVTFAYLEGIPTRGRIKERLTQLWNFERYGVPFELGGRFFYTKNSGLQNQNVLYTTTSLDAEPTVLLDPNTFSTDGTVALAGTEVSEDGNLLAYGTSAAGSDWQEWKVRDVRTGKDTSDLVKWVKFSGASWTKDGKGFYYSRYDAPSEGSQLRAVNQFHKVYYHRLGTTQAEDALIYDRPDQKEWNLNGAVTEDGRYLIITVKRGTDTKNAVFYRDLQTTNSPVVELLKDFDASYDFVGNEGSQFWFLSNKQAPNGRLIALDVTQGDKLQWKEIIPQSEHALKQVTVVNDQFIALYLQHASTHVRIFKLDGAHARDLDLPGMGSAAGFGGLRKDKETFYLFTSFTTPASIYRLDMVTGNSTLFRQPKVDFDPSEYQTTQVFYRSKDNTGIPMFITSKKNLKLDGNNPTYLYGYGGFDISLTPNFSVPNLVFMEMGGVFAVPNLRGGGEYGEPWHQAGVKKHKQNVFDDFIAAAQWLVASNYTRPDKLAIGGGSNGGLLVGACMTQRPELYGAALPAVGVMDMLRFNKFTIGWAWTVEYGSPENAEDFPNLLAYSPYHNLKRGTRYPATLITTADHDDRVVPGHSFKFAAALQEAQGGPAPVLIRIETKAGHGAGKPTSKQIEEAADRWAFLTRALSMTLPARFGGQPVAPPPAKK